MPVGFSIEQQIEYPIEPTTMASSDETNLSNEE
ncbi:hypothetical protein HISP_15715 [Haloarcula hispanica N601]|uniref:Uncharacterized protein n=1 Tax=Haloarcula hispanica N601 TaxID=1417673 RepID=V5TSC4_HALHI|nr:hypothetical protein HISP_15715 [Haloarcula hispanica N601]